MSTIDEAKENALRNLEEKTGKLIAEWVSIARASGHAKHGQIVSYLKSELGLTHGYANMIALRALSKDEPAIGAENDDKMVSAQYEGAKAALIPVYESLVKLVTGFGSDVELAPKRAYVSVRRRKQFAILQPSTASRLDVGINLKNSPPTERLETSGSFNAMLSHRVRVGSFAEVDDELAGWLRAAYDEAG